MTHIELDCKDDLKLLKYEVELRVFCLNPIPAGGGCQFAPPRSFFLQLKKYWSEAVEIFLNDYSPLFRSKIPTS